MLKKYLILIVLVIIMNGVSRSEASISASEASIGGIGIGCSMEYVKSVYGDPTTTRIIQGNWDSGYISYDYNGALQIIFLKKGSNSSVCQVIITASNLSTPAGIRVGDVRRTLDMTYGSPDYSRRETRKNGLELNVLCYNIAGSTRKGDLHALECKMSGGSIVEMSLTDHWYSY